MHFRMEFAVLLLGVGLGAKALGKSKNLKQFDKAYGEIKKAGGVSSITNSFTSFLTQQGISIIYRR